jgi:hypothetical protein
MSVAVTAKADTVSAILRPQPLVLIVDGGRDYHGDDTCGLRLRLYSTSHRIRRRWNMIYAYYQLSRKRGHSESKEDDDCNSGKTARLINLFRSSWSFGTSDLRKLRNVYMLLGEMRMIKCRPPSKTTKQLLIQRPLPLLEQCCPWAIQKVGPDRSMYWCDVRSCIRSA